MAQSIVRSTVDAFTNRAVLTSDELRAELPALVREDGAPPIESMPTFLHEATHHWCFSSPVGTAIAALAMRAEIAAVRATEASSDEERSRWERRAAEDTARAVAATELLRPLHEGFGLFAEFDLAPQHRSPVQPAPVHWAVMFYGRDPRRPDRVGAKPAQFGRALAHLGSVRIAADVRRRKAALLAEPLSCATDGGYLPGYLVLKNLWRFLAANHDRFTAPDTFLIYAYDFFFADDGLVGVLLDPRLEAPDSLTAISQYVRERLLQTYERATVDGLEPYFSALAERRRVAHEAGDFLPASSPGDRSPSDRFVQAWDDVIGRLHEVVPPDPRAWRDSDAVTVGLHSLLYSRDLFEIGRRPVTVTVEGGRARAEADGVHTVTVDAAPRAPSASVDADLRIYLSTRGGHRIVALMGSDGLLGWQAFPAASTADEILHVERSLTGQLALAGLGTFLEPRLDALSSLRELARVDGYRRQTHDLLDSLYQRPAMIYVRDPVFDDVWSTMADDGVYGLVHADGSLVRALALFGILSSNGLVSSQLESWLNDDGATLEESVAQLGRVADETGLFRLAVDDGRVYCTL